MAVATALPTAARDLDGLAFYGWAFTGFLVASIVGIVAAGLLSDSHGPRLPLTLGLVTFALGLIVAGLSPTMLVLVLGRIIQGLSAGLVLTALYVVIGEVYSDRLRPKIFATMATSWIVPGLAGPIISGFLTEHLSWRWVFLGLVPATMLGGILLIPVLRSLRAHPEHGALSDPKRLVHAFVVALAIAAISFASQQLSFVRVMLAVAGVAALGWGLRTLMPPGTMRFAPGVGAPIAFRGLLAGVFFGMESIVPLTLTVQHGYSATASGVPLMVTSLSWAMGSQIQGRLREPNRAQLIRIGLALIGGGGVLMAAVALPQVPGWLAYLAWPMAGLGAGFALTSCGVLLLDNTTDAQRGANSAALQLSDSTVSALCTGFAGVLVAAAANGVMGYGGALASVYLTLAAVSVAGIALAGRARPQSAEQGP